MRQPNFFDKDNSSDPLADEHLTLYALGEFQARGKALAERELPLDRLRGALRRAAERFASEEMSDERAVVALSALGAEVRRVPSYFAKHPFRVTVSSSLADRALSFFRQDS